MELYRDSGTTSIGTTSWGSPATTRLLYWMLVLLSLVPLCLVLPLSSTKTSVGIIAGWTVMIWVAISFARGQFHYITPIWVACFPYCYYFASFPRSRPIFTVDRAFILLLVIDMLLVSRRAFAGALLVRHVRISGYLWALYLVVCFISLAWHAPPHVLDFYRLVVEGMLMPALLGLYAISLFPIARDLKTTHACVCILMLGIAAVAGGELLGGRNLLPSNGASESWVQANDFRIIRVDGPFENSGVLCLVGTLGFFFIIYLRRLIGTSFGRRQRWLHLIGVWASMAAALMPMNRSLVVALLICAFIDYLAEEPLISRRTWNYIFGVLLFFALISKLFYPSVYEDRVSRPENVYQRVAQDLQTLEVVRDHPVLGVGFNLYRDTVAGDAKYSVQFRGIDAMNVPHNSLFSVLAEEGIVGFLLYTGAQLYFVRAMWRLRTINPLGWRVFLYCVLVYTIYGLDVGMAYYSDLNLFYMFVLGVLMQIQLHMLPQGPHANDF
jgi:O-Antigen ligase